ncbi:reactive intermediate imine deaminase A homolog UK114 [Dermatophagoides farinae]|uniref:Enamine/imine deaminase n=1 Tax=Dermatophagoides farinae TaxID=6954 RepID=A0A922IEZ7_DERFA|nr:2-iminobutanoate/2-iminopropanoate deaminase [Dermatophagoides farinae]KAH7638269.1 enamine/imine deaminase [Dermatophagoides farinae]KAH9530311.1 hypothetical protein DERF_004124 [Dermatophagoides farinae]
MSSIIFIQNFVRKSSPLSNFPLLSTINKRLFKVSQTMSPKRIISTPLAPQPIGPYSQAVQVGNTVYLSGQIGMNVRTNEMVTGSIRDEAQQAFTNMKAVVEASGAKMSDVVKVNIFIRNFNDFPAINDVMKEFFQSPFPARSTVGVAELPKNARVEIESIVVIE